MSMSVEISDFLVAQGYGTNTSPSPTIFRQVVPATPDNVIIVSDVPSTGPENVMGGVSHEVMNLSIVVRNKVDATAESLARSMWILLHMKVAFTLGTTHYVGIMARSSPFPLGRDENGRHQWACNYLVRRKEA